MPDAPSSILVRLPNWVGDVVMATPALRALRRAHPAARIVGEGRGFLRGLARGLPGLDEFRADRSPSLAGTLERVRALRRERFDWALVMPDSHASALGPFLARVPLRAGFATDGLRRRLLTVRLEPPREDGRPVPIPMVERYLRLTRALGCADAGNEMELAVDPEADAAVARRLEPLGPAAERLLVVTPGANFGSSKLWPSEHFAAACDGIAERLGLAPVLAPGPGEEALARDVAARARTPVHVLADPTTSLPELAALIARAALVLSNDTGPRAVAVALGRPVVVLMGPTDPRYTALHLERQRVLREDVECSPCHLKTCPIDHRCMTRLAPERAVAAAQELLA